MVKYDYESGSEFPIHQEDNTWNPEHCLERRVVCSPYRDAQRPFLCLSWLGDPDPSGRLGFDLLVVTKVFDQCQSVCGFDGFDSINSRRSLALVLLRDLADGQRPGGFRFHE